VAAASSASTRRCPTCCQAGAYSAVLHYLKAVQAAGTDDTAAVMKQMKKTPINDFFAKGGKIREDGRMVHDMYLVEVKKPAESKEPWDYYNVKQVIPAEPRPSSRWPCRVAPRSRSKPRGSRDDVRMTEIFGIPIQALFGQLMLGLINGSFYAVLSLGLAVIFGLLNIINFAHGALYMMGAFVAWIGLNTWASATGGAGAGAAGGRPARHRIERTDAAMAVQARPPLRPAADLRPGADHRGPVPRPVRRRRASPTRFPRSSQGGFNLGFMFLPNYRAWVVVASLTSAWRPGT
jgi:hypothetical protein